MAAASDRRQQRSRAIVQLHYRDPTSPYWPPGTDRDAELERILKRRGLRLL